MKTIVVTGATSFIASALIEDLIKQKYEVYSVVRPGTLNIDNLIQHTQNHIIYEDLNSISNITSKINHADIFLHFGWEGIGSEGRSNPEIQIRNINNSMCAIKTAVQLGCSKFFFSGSQAEYGIQNTILREDSICKPVSEYGKAKLKFGQMAKEYCNKTNMQFIHLRIFSIYGIRDHQNALIPSCIRCFENGGKIALGDCTQLWNYMYITDFSMALYKLIDTSFKLKNRNYIFNIASDDTRPLKDFIMELYSLSQKKGTFQFGVRSQNAEGAAMLHPDISLLKRVIDWNPEISFSNGITQIINQRRILNG